MAKQTLIIGLGQFGSALARALTQQGSEVIAVDADPSLVNAIAPHVADAVVLDAMDEEALSRLAPAQRDTCVCAIGDDHREASIIVTALLKQLGAPHIIARATDDLHARILALIGAHEVLSPERDYGQRLAIRLAWGTVVDVLPLGGDLVLTEIEAPETFWGRTLTELQLPRRFGVTICAIRYHPEQGVPTTTIPDPNRPLRRGDVLVLVSTERDVRFLTERM